MTLEASIELTDAEVSELPQDRQPHPFEPYRINHPAPGRGQGLKRRSMRGDRWCPYCQTLLAPRKQACPPCKVARDEFNDSHPGRNGVPVLEPQVEDRDLDRLISAVDEMSRVIALASAHQNTRGQLPKSRIEDMFMACKEVIMAADPIRKELRDGSH